LILGQWEFLPTRKDAAEANKQILILDLILGQWEFLSTRKDATEAIEQRIDEAFQEQRIDEAFQ